MTDNVKRYAVLIDIENISVAYAERIFSEIAVKGKITIKRGYGNFIEQKDNNNTRQKKWPEIAGNYGITPCHQLKCASGKNGADIAMVIDAMDILYTHPEIDGYFIVSSDSDFTKLAIRLKENNKEVIVIGESKTPETLRNASDEFISLEAEKPSETESPAEKDKSVMSMNVKQDIDLYLNKEQDEEGWCLANGLGQFLKRKYPDFDYCGYKKLLPLLEFLEYETEKRQDLNNTQNPEGKILYVKAKGE